MQEKRILVSKEFGVELISTKWGAINECLNCCNFAHKYFTRKLSDGPSVHRCVRWISEIFIKSLFITLKPKSIIGRRLFELFVGGRYFDAKLYLRTENRKPFYALGQLTCIVFHFVQWMILYFSCTFIHLYIHSFIRCCNGDFKYTNIHIIELTLKLRSIINCISPDSFVFFLHGNDVAHTYNIFQCSPIYPHETQPPADPKSYSVTIE